MSRLIVFDVDSTLLKVESLDFAVEHALSSAPNATARRPVPLQANHTAPTPHSTRTRALNGTD